MIWIAREKISSTKSWCFQIVYNKKVVLDSRKSTEKTVLCRNREASHQEETVVTEPWWMDGLRVWRDVNHLDSHDVDALQQVHFRSCFVSLAPSSSPPRPPLCSMMSSHQRSLVHLDRDPPALPPGCWFSIPRFLSEIQGQLDVHPGHVWETHWRISGRWAGHLCPVFPE